MGKAFIPPANEYLQGFARINKELAVFSGFQNSETTVTLDMDATLVATNKADTLFCYKGYKAYQPFPTMDMKSQGYKVFGMVTKMDWEGEKLVRWLHERCGKSEEAHGVMKDDLPGGKLPSEDFGENAAWWWIMILALNLNAMMKKLALKGSWCSKRMKAVPCG